MRFRTRLFASLVAAGLFLVTAIDAADAAYKTSAKQALILDYETGAVLFAKNADHLMQPASMTKLMTLYLLFDKLKNGGLSLDDTFPVSKKAWKMPGSKMFVLVGNRVRIEDLIRGIIVQSGNDATIVVAEGIAGSEKAFGEQMTEKARELGMNNTTFRNASGWPDPEHVTTARDLALLTRATIRNFPDFYHYYAEKEFVFAKIRQGNRNPLLYKSIGADGLKTGHTKVSGYGLAASAKRGDRRIILVAHGMQSMRERASESERLLTWGLREFNNYRLFKAGDVVAKADVWLGKAKSIPLTLKQDLVVVIKRSARRKMKVTAKFTAPIAAPIKAGSTVGTLVITAPDLQTVERPLLAANDVPQLGAFGRISAALGHLVWGSMN